MRTLIVISVADRLAEGPPDLPFRAGAASVSNMMDRLIIILLLEDEHEGNRDEAAMDLSEYDDPLAERALIQMASNPQTSNLLAYSCGSSLAEIWVRQNRFPVDAVSHFGKAARFAVIEGIAGKEEWRHDLDSHLP